MNKLNQRGYNVANAKSFLRLGVEVLENVNANLNETVCGIFVLVVLGA